MPPCRPLPWLRYSATDEHDLWPRDHGLNPTTFGCFWSAHRQASRNQRKGVALLEEMILALISLVALGVALAVILVVARRWGSGNAKSSTLDKREQLLDEREQRLNDADRLVQAAREALSGQQAELAEKQVKLSDRNQDIERALAAVADLTPDQARVEVLARAESKAMKRALAISANIESVARAEAEFRARSVIANSIQRLAAAQSADVSVVQVPIPQEEMKGRLIGKDGRNIRSFEQVTGASLLIDDTPAMVEVSCFEPRRRELARLTLVELIADGRVHPGRIEDTYREVEQRLTDESVRAASEIAHGLGITDLDVGIIELLAELRFRTSYGQNVLAHLAETAELAAGLAEQVGADSTLAARAAFLHDLGKALPAHAGPHALAGAEFAQAHGEGSAVVHAIAAHHDDIEPASVEAVLVQAADAISGARPGARNENAARQVERLNRIEDAARELPEVSQAFAVQAGRELRVIVEPSAIEDSALSGLATRLALKLEDLGVGPGNVRVTVVRESRASAVARSSR